MTTEDLQLLGVITLLLSLGCAAWAYLYLLRARLIEDVPTATIRGAAQGYVEIVGEASTAGGGC